MPAIDLDAVAFALRTVISAVTAIPIDRVYMVDQDHPEADHPFATLALAVPVTVTQAERRNVAQVQRHTVEVQSSADGVYTVTVDGILHTFVAAANTATEIRDGLVAAFGASSVATASPDPSSPIRLFVDALVAGVVLDVSVTPNLGLITVGPYSYPTRDALQVQAFANEELAATVQISTRYSETAPTLNASAPSLAEDLRKGVYLPSHHATLKAADCPVLRVGPMLDLSTLTGSQYEQRAAVELTLSVPSVLGEEPGTIDTAEVNGTYS